MLENPFTLDSIEDKNKLIGRDTFLKMFEYYINSNGGVLLVGGRRTGKTSLFKTFQKEKSKDYEIVYWNVFHNEDGLDYLINNILNIDYKQNFTDLRDFIIYIKRERKEKKKLIILLDEFEVLLHAKAIKEEHYSYIRSLLIEFSKYFHVVISVPVKKVDLYERTENLKGSGLLNMFAEIYLPPLEIEKNQFYDKYLDSWGEEYRDKFNSFFSDEEIKHIYKWAGRHPYMLQYMGDRIWIEKIFENRVDIKEVIRQIQDEYESLLIKWYKKKYIKLEDIIHLLLLKDGYKNIKNRKFFECWGFINRDGEIESLGISLAITKCLTYAIESYSENEDIMELDKYLNAYQVEEKLEDAIMKPMFYKLVLNGLLIVSNGEVIKNA